MNLLKEELTNISQFVRQNGDEAIIFVSATLFFVLDRYHPIQNEWLSSIIYFAVLPILVILFLLRKNPLDFGLGLGNVRVWGFYVLIIVLASAVILYAAYYDRTLQDYYQVDNFKLSSYFLTSLLSLSAQEFIYRGFLLFGLRGKFKEGAIFIQMIPFALLHLAKPELETLSTIITECYLATLPIVGSLIGRP
jgi:membrane protease YdiL (CAAX protease family)